MRNIKAALCYSGLSFFFIKDKDEFIRFHAKQGIVLFIGIIIALLIPLVGWAIGLPFIAVISIVAANRALAGQKWKIPFIHFFTKFIK